MPDKILSKAQEVVYGDRAKRYGDANELFLKVSATYYELTGQDVAPENIVIMMVIIKLVREQYSHQMDNLVDIAGYTELYAQIIGGLDED